MSDDLINAKGSIIKRFRRKSNDKAYKVTQCKKCVYHTVSGVNDIWCGFCMYTGKLRGCDPKECKRFTPIVENRELYHQLRKKRSWLSMNLPNEGEY